MPMSCVCLQRRQVRKSLDSLDAFLLVDGSEFALRGAALASFTTRPGLHAQHAERQTLRTDRQQAVHQEPALIATGTAPQTFCGRQMRQVKLGCALYHQHHWDLLHTVQRLHNRWRQYTISVELVVVKESIGCLQFSRRQRLRQPRVGTSRQLSGKCHQPVREACVTETRRCEFLARPVRRVVPDRQSAAAASTE